ncbi:MAG TPA: DUF6364 family protein [Mucilaginibacter sp.]|jgi:hypothetical protein|nr:DUF6364 family protein [Mucilaginibacter sp.]
MKTKLTLTMEGHVIDSAKEYAREKGESLSVIVENYLKSITISEGQNLVISDKVRKMMGVISLPDDFDYEKKLGSVIFKKVSR